MKNNETALIVIELQKESGFGLSGLDSVVRSTQRMIAACRTAGIPVFYTRQINRHDGTGLSLDEPHLENGEPRFYPDNVSSRRGHEPEKTASSLPNRNHPLISFAHEFREPAVFS